jgi:hypothetical protein
MSRTSQPQIAPFNEKLNQLDDSVIKLGIEINDLEEK